MELDLPPLPKGVVLNGALIAAIALGMIISVVGLWSFLPLFLEPPAERQASELEVSFEYLRTVHPGMDWPINGTAHNPSQETLSNIRFRVFSDSNIQGYEQVMVSLAPGETKSFVLHPRVKESAFFGNFTAQTVVSVPETFPAEYALDIFITDPF